MKYRPRAKEVEAIQLVAQMGEFANVGDYLVIEDGQQFFVAREKFEAQYELITEDNKKAELEEIVKELLNKHQHYPFTGPSAPPTIVVNPAPQVPNYRSTAREALMIGNSHD